MTDETTDCIHCFINDHLAKMSARTGGVDAFDAVERIALALAQFINMAPTPDDKASLMRAAVMKLATETGTKAKLMAGPVAQAMFDAVGEKKH